MLYRDPLTGKTRLASWFKIVLVVVGLAVLVVLAGYAYTLAQYRASVARVNAASTALALTQTAVPPTATPSPTATVTATPTPLPTPTEAANADLIEQVTNCPGPEAWTTESVWPERNHPWRYILEPECALLGVSRVMTWVIAIQSLGYTPEEAAAFLGFDQVPALYPRSPKAAEGVPFRDAKGVWSAPVHIHSTLTLGIRMWDVPPEGRTLPNYGVLVAGCFPAQAVRGGRVHSWQEDFNAPFTYECVVYLDAWDGGYEYVVLQDPDSGYVMAKTPSGTGRRSTHLVGWIPERGWVYLGRIRDNARVYDLTDPDQRPFYLSEVEQARQEGRYWYLDDLSTMWGIEMQPLPEGWEEHVVDKDTWRAFYQERKEAWTAYREKYGWPYKAYDGR